MALFGKKTTTCALCGKEVKTGFFRGLFQREIEGQYVCDDCYGEVDLPTSFTVDMTLDQFRGYKAFQAENRKLKDQFRITQEVDFGVLEEKFYFDTIHNLMCMDKNLEKTIFEGNQICGFTIKEDEHVIFQGSTAGLLSNESSVRYKVLGMANAVRAYCTQMRDYEAQLERASDAQKDQIRKPVPNFDTKPFYSFRVEIYLDHPYWNTLTAELPAPDFDNTRPNVMDYMRIYDQRYGAMQQLAHALTAIAFSGR